MRGPVLVRPYFSVAFALFGLTALGACHRDSAPSSGGDAGPASATAPSGSSPAGSAAAAAASGDCLTTMDFLLPFQSYKNGDMVRAITVDGDQVLFRNADDLMRMPLAGGPPVTLSSAPSMTLQLNSHPTMWLAGDKIVTQSPGAPAFVEAPKSGGAWTTIVNLSGGELGSKLVTGNHVVHTIFSGVPENADPAIFDGSSFYWIEWHNASKGKPGASAIRTVPLSGSPAKTLYEWAGDLRSLARAGDRLVFERTDPKKEAPPPPPHPKGKIAFDIPAPRPTYLMTIQKPGLFRISARPGSPLERIDDRHVSGEGFVYGERFVLAGHGSIEPKPPHGDVFGNQGLVVMTGDRHGGAPQRAACIRGNYTEHAYAIAGKSLLVSIENSDDRKAAIIRIPLP
jgi:hypothetical protein